MKTKDKSFFIMADYEEYFPETYKGIYLDSKGKELFRSNTGKVKKDYKNVLDWARKNVQGVIYRSSTVDNYFMDVQ